MKHFTHSRISEELYKTLIEISIFKVQPEKICLADWLLKEIDRLSHLNTRKAGWAFVSGDYLRKKFRGAYSAYIKPLESLGLVENDHHYEIGNRPHAYRLTHKGLAIVLSSRRSYLKALRTDTPLRRAIQMSIVSRKVMKKSFNDPVLDYIWDGLINTSFDEAEAERIMQDIAAKASNVQEAMRSESHTQYILTTFAEKRFEHLKYNDSDSRLWNGYVALSSAFRGLATYTQADGNELKRLAVIDLRACFGNANILL